MSDKPTKEQLDEWKKSPNHTDDGEYLGDFRAKPEKPAEKPADKPVKDE